ncbi:MAG: NAD(P)-binding protein, partial [Lachnospiraceae bacterium]|nr:NAD(P)-binding protein [Lachnospiraceae bacterium]
MYECVIAGTGFTGAVAARVLAEAGVRVRIAERREHIAGNMYDERM